MKPLALLILLSAGCSQLRLSRPPHTTQGPILAALPPSSACLSLSHKTLAWNLTGIATGAIGSGAASGAGVFSSNEIARYSLLGAAAIFSLGGALASYLGGWYAAQYTKKCN